MSMSSSSHGDANETESCTWEPGLECERPRSCFACLEATACAIDPYGQCVPMTQYVAKYDFRVRNDHTDGLYSYYPSTNTTYCTQTDTKCQRCRDMTITAVAGFSGFGYRRNLRPFCLGVDGCVCVAACETTKWRSNILTREQCPLSSDNSTASDASSDRHKTYRAAMILMSMAFLGLIILCILIHRWYVHSRVGERIRERRARFAGMKLRLEGWHSMRQELIAAESGRRQHVPADSASVSEGVGSAVDTDAGLVVDQGCCYRPLSPSAHAPTHY